LKRNKVLHEEIQELEDWVMDKEREAPADDGPVFYQEQLRERLEQYQVKAKRCVLVIFISFFSRNCKPNLILKKILYEI
jgi:hypothetical protein